MDTVSHPSELKSPAIGTSPGFPKKNVDDDRVMQWFSPRREGGLWSAVNKERIDQLVGAGHMTEVGQAAIDRAKADGSWSQLDDVDALIVPPDLQPALDAVPETLTAYQGLGDSAKKQYLWWITRPNGLA
jgi:uncharacterized protein YdeI (YjbR/CyaY-like superfamily)